MLFSLKSKGYHFNSALHILIYGALIVIAIGTAAHLNTEHEDAAGKKRPLYQSCKLNGTATALTEKDTCIPLNGTYGTGDDKDVWVILRQLGNPSLPKKRPRSQTWRPKTRNVMLKRKQPSKVFNL